MNRDAAMGLLDRLRAAKNDFYAVGSDAVPGSFLLQTSQRNGGF